MIKKQSSYAKMKQHYEGEILKLTKDIVAMVDGSDYESSIVKVRWKLNIDANNLMMSGVPTILTDRK